MSRETEDLATHVEICAVRYKAIEDRFYRVDLRMDVIDQNFDRIDRNFTEIKELINRQRDSKFNTMVTTAGTVIVALLGVLGYMIVKLN